MEIYDNVYEKIENSLDDIMQIEPRLNLQTLKEHILHNDSLKLKELYLNFCNNKYVHKPWNLTFEEVFIRVYDYILKHEHKDELFEILEDTMSDDCAKSFIGCIARLTYVWNIAVVM